MISMNLKKQKVVICKDCNGAGLIYKDPGQHEYRYEMHSCRTCKGTGKLIKETQVSYRPYFGEPALIIKI